MAYSPYDPLKKKQTQLQPPASGMAIAPPPPVPPTPPPTLQPPPNAIGEPADMDIKRQMMGLIAQPTQFQTTPSNPIAQNTAIQPNTAPPPASPMPAVAPPVTRMDTGIQSTVGAPLSYTFLPGNPNPQYLNPDGTYTELNPSSANPFSVNPQTVGLTGPQSPPPAAPAPPVIDPATGQPARPEGMPADAYWNPELSKWVPGDSVSLFSFDQQWNPNNPQVAGQIELQRRFDANDPTLPGTPAYFAANGMDPNEGWSGEGAMGPREAETYYHANTPPEPEYGSGPDSRGYIRTAADQYGEDPDEQQRIQDELRGLIGSGQGTGGWEPATPATPVTPQPVEPPFTATPSNPIPTTPGGPGSPGEGAPGDEATDDELRALINERAGREPAELSDLRDPAAMFEQGADALEARLERGYAQNERRIRERMAARGTLDGSPEDAEIRELMAEQNVQRMEGLSQLNRERYGFSLDARAQELQKYGIDTSLAYQYASLEQDAGFRKEALELQRLGMNMDESYRYAALAQDSKFRQQVLDLQREGMTKDEAYRQAELQMRKEQFGTQADIQRAGLDLERQRLVSQTQAALYASEIEWKDVPSWIKDILKPDWRTNPPTNPNPNPTGNGGENGDEIPWYMDPGVPDYVRDAYRRAAEQNK